VACVQEKWTVLQGALYLTHIASRRPGRSSDFHDRM
jgi:hypothetical protein